MTTLELLPMWSGVDPDEEVFVSGVVKDDDGDWGVGGQGLGQEDTPAPAPAKETEAGGSSAGGSSAGGSGSGGSGSGGGTAPGPDMPAAPADPVMVGGTRMFLSQCREWVVEYSADQLFLSIRTDAGWYRLCR
jgi:DNA (cytosine-5)-methyltransferase 1